MGMEAVATTGNGRRRNRHVARARQGALRPPQASPLQTADNPQTFARPQDHHGCAGASAALAARTKKRPGFPRRLWVRRSTGCRLRKVRPMPAGQDGRTRAVAVENAPHSWTSGRGLGAGARRSCARSPGGAVPDAGTATSPYGLCGTLRHAVHSPGPMSRPAPPQTQYKHPSEAHKAFRPFFDKALFAKIVASQNLLW